LIKQGAKLVQEWNDVIVELPAELRRKLIHDGQQRLLPDTEATPGDVQEPPELSRTSRQTLSALKPDDAMHIDQLFETLEPCSSSEITAALFELEMLGLVRQLPGRNYIRVW